MHITKDIENKKVNADEIFDENDEVKRTLTSLWKSLDSRGIDTALIKENIKRTCSLTMQLYTPLIEQQIHATSNFKTFEGMPF